MIDIKLASEKALEHFASLFPQIDEKDVMLEEAELSKDEQFWEITVSYKIPKGEKIGETFFGETRSFKTFRLEAETGEVKSMKVRTMSK